MNEIEQEFEAEERMSMDECCDTIIEDVRSGRDKKYLMNRVRARINIMIALQTRRREPENKGL